MLYLELVEPGRPVAVLRCKTCVLVNGSYEVLCYDGPYMGIRARHRRDMAGIKVALDICAPATAWC